MKLTFWGAVEGVTGSMTFVDLPEGRLLIDCGMKQGETELDPLEELKLPFAPEKIDAVIITHAHFDHSGYLPRLVKDGFTGKIHTTPATAKLMKVILTDSAGLNDGDLYDETDVTKTMNRVVVHDWLQSFEILGARVRFYSAGHILGASSVEVSCEGKKIIFSGDLGRHNDPLIPAPQPAPTADLVVMESTYGGRNRQGDMVKELHSFIMTVSRENRVGIIASFAVARAQLLLTLIHDFFTRHPEDKVRVVFDSPMMDAANRIYQQYSHLTQCPHEVFESLAQFESIDNPREWDSLKKKTGPLIIVSSSGMLNGGRVLRHLENWQDDERAILFLPGYQAEGTPGRGMLEGQRQLVNREGQTVWWSGEVLSSEAFSSHADQGELLAWLESNPNTKIALIHGEAEAKQLLKMKLEEIGHEVLLPGKGTTVILS
jgi:metallo-beta-lactamase family protein